MKVPVRAPEMNDDLCVGGVASAEPLNWVRQCGSLWFEAEPPPARRRPGGVDPTLQSAAGRAAPAQLGSNTRLCTHRFDGRVRIPVFDQRPRDDTRDRRQLAGIEHRR